MAHPAGLHLDADLTRLGLGYVAFDHFQTRVGFRDLNGFHFWHGRHNKPRTRGREVANGASWVTIM